MHDVNMSAAGSLQSQVQGVRYIPSPQIGAKLTRVAVAAVIIQDRAEIEPLPTQDFEIGHAATVIFWLSFVRSSTVRNTVAKVSEDAAQFFSPVMQSCSRGPRRTKKWLPEHMGHHSAITQRFDKLIFCRGSNIGTHG